MPVVTEEKRARRTATRRKRLSSAKTARNLAWQQQRDTIVGTLHAEKDSRCLTSAQISKESGVTAATVDTLLDKSRKPHARSLRLLATWLRRCGHLLLEAPETASTGPRNPLRGP